MKKITDVMDLGEEVSAEQSKVMPKMSKKTVPSKQTHSVAELTEQIKQLESQMMQYARELEFEKAAAIRDEVHLLQQQLLKS